MCWIENESLSAQILFSLLQFFNLKKNILICWLHITHIQNGNKMIERKPMTPERCLSVYIETNIILKRLFFSTRCNYNTFWDPHRCIVYSLQTTRPSTMFFLFSSVYVLCVYGVSFLNDGYANFFPQTISLSLSHWTCTRSQRGPFHFIYSMNCPSAVNIFHNNRVYNRHRTSDKYN